MLLPRPKLFKRKVRKKKESSFISSIIQIFTACFCIKSKKREIEEIEEDEEDTYRVITYKEYLEKRMATGKLE